MNLRPAQTLGILKALFAVGAEYFHVGFFNGVARGENWVWQTVMPTYAQGTAMAVNDLFRSSTLLTGDMPLPKLGCYTLGFERLKQNHTLLAQCSDVNTAECQSENIVATGKLCQAPSTGGWHGPVSYRFWAGSQSVAVYVRKHYSRSTYLLYGTVQPQSNMIGNAPVTVNASVRIEGSTIVFEVRRQGSTYVLDNSTSSPSLTQVDGWHESTHPSYWAKSFVFEAEAHTLLATDARSSAHTRTERRPEVAEGMMDFVGSTSFVSVSAEPLQSDVATYTHTEAFQYIFRPRRRVVGSAGLMAWVRLRRPTHVPEDASCCVELSVDERTVGSACAITEPGWHEFCWRYVGPVVAPALVGEATHTLTMRPIPNAAETQVDALGLFAPDEVPSEGLC